MNKYTLCNISSIIYWA